MEKTDDRPSELPLLGPADDRDQITTATNSSTNVVTRVYKKCAANGSLAVYVGTRTIGIEGAHLEPLRGLVVFDRESLEAATPGFRVWGQVTLTFRYGREDEEVLGLRFCNEAILALRQLWPPDEVTQNDDPLTPLQSVLLERVRSSASNESIQAVPFVLAGGPVGLAGSRPPPSVLLAPAKPYKGSPIGTLYDLRIYVSDQPEERPARRHQIRLALRAVEPPPTSLGGEVSLSLSSRPSFLLRGKIHVRVSLDSNAVRYGDALHFSVEIENKSRSSVRRLDVSLIQQVDVCMFTSGKFKNSVAGAEGPCVVSPGAVLAKRFSLTPIRGPARQWLALEEAFGRDQSLAPSSSAAEDRNVFAIIVSYYVKVKVGAGLRSFGLKVPFILLPPAEAEPDTYPPPKCPDSE